MAVNQFLRSNLRTIGCTLVVFNNSPQRVFLSFNGDAAMVIDPLDCHDHSITKMDLSRSAETRECCKHADIKILFSGRRSW